MTDGDATDGAATTPDGDPAPGTAASLFDDPPPAGESGAMGDTDAEPIDLDAIFGESPASPTSSASTSANIGNLFAESGSTPDDPAPDPLPVMDLTPPAAPLPARGVTPTSTSTPADAATPAAPAMRTAEAPAPASTEPSASPAPATAPRPGGEEAVETTMPELADRSKQTTGGAVLADGPAVEADLSPAAAERLFGGTGDAGVVSGAVTSTPASGDDGSPLAQLRHAPQPRSRWWRIGYPIVIALVVLAIPTLLWFGKEAILDSTDGSLVTQVDDPAAPGYEAITVPTPTMLLAQVDSDGALGSATLLTLAGSTTGGVVSMPPDLVVADGASATSLGAAYESGGLAQLETLMETELNLAVAETRDVRADEWADLLAPVGALTVDNPDIITITATDGTPATLARGQVQLAPGEVGSYLETRKDGESDLNRMTRQQRVWAAWLQAIAAAGETPGVVPGEVETGLGRFVRELAVTQVEMTTLPLSQVPLPGTTASVFSPVVEEIVPLVARLVPFPIGPTPGSRLRVRLLDGTGTLQNGLPAAYDLVVGGAEIPMVGNAAAFDRPTTQFIFSDESRRAEVEGLRDALGVGELITTAEVNDAIDVTVILGADAAPLLTGSGTVTTVTSVATDPADG